MKVLFVQHAPVVTETMLGLNRTTYLCRYCEKLLLFSLYSIISWLLRVVFRCTVFLDNCWEYFCDSFGRAVFSCITERSFSAFNSFCADMAASSGGYYDVVDTLDRKQSQVVYDPVSSKKRVCFVYDMEHPVHCSDKQGECNTKPLELSTRLTRVPDIRVFVNGWFDPIPKGGTNKSASQIDKFILEVHRVDLNPTSIKVQVWPQLQTYLFFPSQFRETFLFSRITGKYQFDL